MCRKSLIETGRDGVFIELGQAIRLWICPTHGGIRLDKVSRPLDGWGKNILKDINYKVIYWDFLGNIFDWIWLRFLPYLSWSSTRRVSKIGFGNENCYWNFKIKFCTPNFFIIRNINIFVRSAKMKILEC